MAQTKWSITTLVVSSMDSHNRDGANFRLKCVQFVLVGLVTNIGYDSEPSVTSKKLPFQLNINRQD